MKTKGLVVIIVIITLIILGMSGYFLYNRMSVKNNNQEKKVAQKEDHIEADTIKIDSDKDYIYDADYKYASELDVANYKSLDVIDKPNELLRGKGTIAVPYININTDDASKVNKEIENLYNSVMPKVEESIKCYDNEKDTCEDVYLNYITYLSDNYVSVIIITGASATAIPNSTYYGYVFDLQTGNLLTSNDIANVKGIGLTELENKTKEAIKKYGDSEDKIQKEAGQENAIFSPYYEQTYAGLSKSINNQGKAGYDIDGIIYFFDEDDNLKVLVKINVGTEAGQYVYLLDIE